MLARKDRRGTADFIHRGSGIGSFNRVGLPGHPSVLERPSGRFRKSAHRRNALWCSAKAPERTLWACAVALAQRGPVGLGGGSMRPNAYGASGSDSKTGNFRRGTARKRHWLMPRISFLPSRSVSDRRGHVAMRNSHWPMGLDIFGVNCARWSMTMHRASLLKRRAVLAGLCLAFPELRFALSLTSAVRIRRAKTFRGPVGLDKIFVARGQMCRK